MAAMKFMLALVFILVLCILQVALDSGRGSFAHSAPSWPVSVEADGLE